MSFEFSNLHMLWSSVILSAAFLITSALVNRFVTSIKSCFVSQTIVHLVDLCFFSFYNSNVFLIACRLLIVQFVKPAVPCY